MRKALWVFVVSLFAGVIACKTGGPSEAREHTEAPPAVLETREVPPEPASEAAPDPASTEKISEYERSIAGMEDTVSETTFIHDKDSIMSAINDLKSIMLRQDVKKWRTYLSESSLAYLDNPENLKAVSDRLVGKGPIRNDEEYFKQMFIPSRQGRIINEIRYVSPDVIKAVQARQHDDVIYYYFEKNNGEWRVKLDAMQN